MNSFITVEGGDSIGRGGQNLYQRTQDIRANLQKLVGQLEPSAKDWQGASGTSFNNAKHTLFEKYDLIVASLGLISGGLGQTQTTVNVADTNSGDDVNQAGSQTESVMTRPITVNI